MIKAYLNYWLKAFDFKSKISRKDYWLTILASFIVSFIIGIILRVVFEYEVIIDYTNFIVTRVAADPGLLINDIWAYLNIIPSLSMAIRRLHDINRSGFWVLIALVPVIGWIWLLILLIKPSKK